LKRFLAPQYSSEIAEKEIRGILGTFFQLLINVGILFVYCIGPFLSVEWTSAVCGMVAILFGVIFLFMPESPVYLVTENRIDDAKKSYKWLRGSDYDPQDEINTLKEELDELNKNETPMSEVFARRSTKMALVIGFGLMLFQQLSGINVVIFFSTRIFIVIDRNLIKICAYLISLF
jgi:MFS family permease